jgi:hypothetical protein
MTICQFPEAIFQASLVRGAPRHRACSTTRTPLVSALFWGDKRMRDHRRQAIRATKKQALHRFQRQLQLLVASMI